MFLAKYFSNVQDKVYFNLFFNFDLKLLYVSVVKIKYV